MRIVGGSLGGLTLAGLGKGDPAAHLRPTTDRVRESLFNLLAHGAGDPVPDARVLDLFAGTGALGLEALSRGAAHVCFVESGRKAQGLIRTNIAKARAEAVCHLVRRDARRPGPVPDAPFDLVFLDPPYGTTLGGEALAAALKGGWLAQGALIVWEDSGPVTLPPDLLRTDERRYGDTTITLARYQPG
ncbi:16S rRNA (guanine(966)-N(2))-methyltransferase RsmD [Tranquillimonas rosea]|uniref:16S rRNA (guanine(966)-N(2))-methyltransferase RsmD n=1 Tax=Tranquillimonas rosea TaxID=641238 RepID=UPI003BAC629B